MAAVADGRSGGDARKRRRMVAWCLVIAWAAVIFFVSAHTGNDLDNGSGLVAVAKRWLAAAAAGLLGREVDVSPVGHFLEYFVFGVLLALAWRATLAPERPAARPVTAALAVAAAYAASDELHQLFVPGRSCDPADWAVDMVAVLIAAAVTTVLARRRSREAGGRTRTP